MLLTKLALPGRPQERLPGYRNPNLKVSASDVRGWCFHFMSGYHLYPAQKLGVPDNFSIKKNIPILFKGNVYETQFWRHI